AHVRYPSRVQLVAAMNPCLRVALRPELYWTLVAPRNPPPGTLGEHLRRKRHQKGLLQREAAAAIGVNEWTYRSWETDLKKPSVAFWPKAIRYLGYDPVPEPKSDAEVIEAFRRRTGRTYAGLARELRLDVETVTMWAQGRWRPRVRTEKFKKLLDL